MLETHNHADHLSGRGRLAEATGAAIHVPNADEVAFDAEPVRDGTVVRVGDARIVAVATPGHRPEHVAYLVEDGARGDAPWLVLTGDSLFVGDLARPDSRSRPRRAPASSIGRCGSCSLSTTSSRCTPGTSAGRSAAAPG